MSSIVDSLKGWLGLGGGEPRISNPKHLVTDFGLVFEVEETRRGGMAVVYLCRVVSGKFADTDAEGLRMALKTFSEKDFFKFEMVDVVSRETSTWVKLSEVPFVMPLIAIFTIDKKPHLAMPVAESEQTGIHSLAGLIRASDRGLVSSECLRYALCLALAMERAADRIPDLVHGDLKPDNVLIMGTVPYLADFGLAGLASERGRRGTREFMAPELWENEGLQTVRTDVYAFGVLLVQMLTGASPFVATGEEPADWRSVHTEKPPQLLPVSDDPLASELGQLAVSCLAKFPTDRPEDFRALLAALLAIGGRHAPEIPLWVLSRGAELRRHAVELRQSTALHHVRALLRQRDLQSALDLLKQVADDELSGELLLLAGSAWSLAGEDEKAVSYFERFLDGNPDQASTIRCLSEYGLSLRRLKRFPEAEKLLRDLCMKTIGDAELHIVVRTNYAGALLDLGDLPGAAKHLEWVIRSDPDRAEPRAAYATVLGMQNRVDEAVGMIESAAAIEPTNGLYQLQRAELLLQANDPLRALHAVDRAYALGYHSPQWAMLAIAVNMILGNRQEVMELNEVLEQKYPDKLREIVTEEAFDRIRAYVLLNSPTEESLGAPSVESLLPVIQAPDVPEVDPARAPVAADAAEPHDEQAYRVTINAGKTAHFQVRMSTVDGSFSIDYYYDSYAPDFLDRFEEGYKQARFHWDTEGAAERASLYRFARCSLCRFVLLTTRDEGERFNCQACGEKGSLQSVRSPRTDGLSIECNRLIGKHVEESSSEEIQVVAFWEEDSGRSLVIEQRMMAAGYALAPRDCRAFAYFYSQMEKHNAHVDTPPTLVWHRLLVEGPEAMEQVTVNLDRLLRELRREIGNVSSASSMIDASIGNLLLADVSERLRLARGLAAEHPGPKARDLLLVALLEVGSLDEAFQEATALQLAFPDDCDALTGVARVALARGECHVAIELLEQVLVAEPRHRSARILIIDAYTKSGNADEVSRHALELSSLGIM